LPIGWRYTEVQRVPDIDSYEAVGDFTGEEIKVIFEDLNVFHEDIVAYWEKVPPDVFSRGDITICIDVFEKYFYGLWGMGCYYPSTGW